MLSVAKNGGDVVFFGTEDELIFLTPRNNGSIESETMKQALN